MNRQGFPYIRLSERYLRKGLFASLAVLMTLIGGQQWVRWDQSPQVAATVLHVVAPQQHFSAVSSSGGYNLAVTEETEIARSEAPQERWVF